MISDTCYECHKHQTCFLCGEVIDWIEDYGHVHADGRGSCNTCYDTRDAALVWYEQYESRQRMWNAFDRLMKTHPHLFAERLKELDRSND